MAILGVTFTVTPEVVTLLLVALAGTGLFLTIVSRFGWLRLLSASATQSAWLPRRCS